MTMKRGEYRCVKSLRKRASVAHKKAPAQTRSGPLMLNCWELSACLMAIEDESTGHRGQGESGVSFSFALRNKWKFAIPGL